MRRTRFLIGVGVSQIGTRVPKPAKEIPGMIDPGIAAELDGRSDESARGQPPIDTSEALDPLTEAIAAAGQRSPEPAGLIAGGPAAAASVADAIAISPAAPGLSDPFQAFRPSPQPDRPGSGAADRPRRQAESSNNERQGGRRRISLPVLMLFGTMLAVNLAGLAYYLLPVAGRVRSPLHPWFRPSGYVGQSAGLLALVFFVFIWLYPLRKRVRWLSFTGSMKRWLDLHIVAGLALPALGAIHASWRFTGLIGLGYVAMLVVCASGIIGKYIYTRIPRRRNGIELSLEELGARRQEMIDRIAAATGLERSTIEKDLALASPPARDQGIGRTITRLLLDDLTRWRVSRALRRRWTGGAAGRGPDRAALAQALRLARKELALTQRARMLESTHALFRFWHVAHLPFAITALVAVVLHVAVVVALGATWLW